MKDQCKAAVAAALGKPVLTAQESQRIEQKIIDAKTALARKDIQTWRNLSEAEKLSQAGEYVADEIQRQLTRKIKIAIQDINLQNKNFSDINHPTLPASQALDRKIAHFGDMSGVQSLDTHARAIATLAKADIQDFYTKIKGGLGLFTDKKLVDNFIRERFGEDTGDVLAKKIADKVGDVNNGLRERFNRAGGDIGNLGDKFGLPTHWNSEKFTKDRLDIWLNLAKKNIDPNILVKADGSLMNPDEINKFLLDTFETIRMDGLNKVEVGEKKYSGSSKVTNRMNESRVLHWKNADAWLEMQSEFGGLPLVDLIDAHIDTMAKNISLVETFGSNPNAALDILKQEAARIDKEKGLTDKQINRGLNRAQLMYDVFANNGNSVESQVLNNMGLIYRSWNTAAMLGSAVLSAVSDIAPMLKMASMHGLAWNKVFSEMVKGLDPRNTQHREMARSLGLGIDEMTGALARWGAEDITDVHSRSSKIARFSQSTATTVLRASGLNAWSSITKQAWTKVLMDKYGQMTKEKSWSDLHPDDKDLFNKTGLDEQTWEVMRLAEAIDDGSGNLLMSARSIHQIPDEKLKHMGDPQRIRDEAATKFHAHLMDEQGMAIIETGLRERTRIYGKTTGGDFSGFLLRGYMQFKSFPVAFLMRHGSRMMAQPTLQGKGWYGISLAMGMTFLGGLSVQLSEIASGNDPQTIWDSEDPEKAMTFFFRSVAKGGGLSLLGDVFAAGSDPMGRDSRDMLIGPLGSDFANLTKLTAGTINKWYEGKDLTNTPNEVYRFLKSKIPGQNLWYTKAATNRIMFDNIQDTLAPGYRERLIRKAEREQDRTRWWGDDLDIRSPNFEKVID